MPRRTPDALKKIKATTRKDRTRPDVSEQPLQRLPAPPEDFNKFELTAWRKLGRACLIRRTLTRGDLSALAAAARAVAMVTKLHLAIEDANLVVPGGKGGDKINPLITEARQWQTIARHWMSALGLTPSSRSDAQPMVPKPRRSDFDNF